MTDNQLEIAQFPAQKNIVNLFNRDVRYLKTNDVKRAYSILVQNFCKGLLQNDDAKTLAYLLSGYLQVVKTIDFEDRIKQLEIKISQTDNFNSE